MRCRICLGICVAVAASHAGCFESQGCTLAGCGDAVRAEIHTADGTWADGEYRLSIRFDGLEHVCAITLPDQVPDGSRISEHLDCVPPLLGASFYVVTDCVTSSSESHCEPVDGQYYFAFSTQRTPSRMATLLERNGAVVLSDERDLHYTKTYPNGPSCDPGCPTTQVQLTARP